MNIISRLGHRNLDRVPTVHILTKCIKFQVCSRSKHLVHQGTAFLSDLLQRLC